MKALIAIVALCWATNSFASLSTISTVMFLYSHLIPKEMTITAKGSGATQSKAIEEALLASVQKGLGVMVVSDLKVQDEKVIRNLAAMYSSGIVQSYEVNGCTTTTPVVCEVTALVSPHAFERTLAENTFKGQDLYAEHLTAKSTLIQRRKIIDYYFSSIREHGLRAKVQNIRVIPTTGDRAKIEVKYSVYWNHQYKREFINFLEVLEKDTNASFDKHDLVLQWSAANLFKNRVFLSTDDENTRFLIEKKLYEPVTIYFEELNRCETIQLDSSILNFDVTRKQTFEIGTDQLKGLNKLTVSTRCKQKL